ncbi:MAG: prepilin-type N-terminal cleavage/methylation domain-containing protein [Elusimicrobia bacterium]|nr:prepilin-type N-terminal cleavage/methylation domain-containing protein [Elusimicrobiota bacterium]MDY5729655.1 prepilin-type N-terminal cleavage/methylation domain-containing protein [Elusimicrobiaceae bacterium]
MKKTKKKEAFTLTELLVVVIVIGVLAAIVLPKFSKVMETRKTTEAEELMAAVRTEQERRCALDKPYATEFTQMRDLVASSQATKYTTKNYVYELGNTGMQALSTGKYGYTLQMPSYRDGRLCCESAQQCANLNKDYPTCEQLQARADYQDGKECAGDGAQEPSECVDGATQGTQTCNICGKQTTQLCVNGTWTEQLGACSKNETDCRIPAEKQCADASKPSTSCGNCNRGTRSVTCEDSTWVTGECVEPEWACTPKKIKTQGGKTCGENLGFMQMKMVGEDSKNEWKAGYVCNKSCVWEELDCWSAPPSSGGSGGGGGGNAGPVGSPCEVYDTNMEGGGMDCKVRFQTCSYDGYSQVELVSVSCY